MTGAGYRPVIRSAPVIRAERTARLRMATSSPCVGTLPTVSILNTTRLTGETALATPLRHPAIFSSKLVLGLFVDHSGLDNHSGASAGPVKPPIGRHSNIVRLGIAKVYGVQPAGLQIQHRNAIPAAPASRNAGRGDLSEVKVLSLRVDSDAYGLFQVAQQEVYVAFSAAI